MRKGKTTKQKGGRKTGNSWVKTGLYVNINENALDGRTWLGKLVKQLRAELTDYLGETTPLMDILIQRCVYKHLRLSFYETSNLAKAEHGELQDYVCLSNSLRLDLQSLAQMPGKKPGKVKNLQSILAGHRANNETGSS